MRSSVPVTSEDQPAVSRDPPARVTVEAAAADLIETTSTEHTDVDRNLFEQLPLESASSSVSSLITLASPGIVADSNGLFHGLGDHAENSFSMDGQPITDQQSKVFSNQIPVGRHSVHGSDRGRAARGVRRQDQRDHQRHHALRSGRHARRTGSVTHVLRHALARPTAASISPSEARSGANFISANGLNTGRFLDPAGIHGDARQGQPGKYL